MDVNSERTRCARREWCCARSAAQPGTALRDRVLWARRLMSSGELGGDCLAERPAVRVAVVAFESVPIEVVPVAERLRVLRCKRREGHAGACGLTGGGSVFAAGVDGLAAVVICSDDESCMLCQSWYA